MQIRNSASAPISIRKSIYKKGFTLIELLVVIAIIAILAAILFPVFGRARENARRSSCQSNLKQIGLGIVQYTQDFDEAMPINSYGYVNASTNPGDWMDVVQPYVKNYQIFKCPSDTRQVADPAFNNQVSSYGINFVGWGDFPGSNAPPMSDGTNTTIVASIDSPSTTILALDNNGFQMSRKWADLGTVSSDANRIPSIDTAVSPRAIATVSERHLETTNVLWCDGHVKAVKLDALRTSGIAPNAGKGTYWTRGADPS